MKILIAYSTKSGAARKCAGLLAQELSGCIISDLEKESPRPDDFDIIIIGSGVRMGKLYKPVCNFIKENQAALLQKRVAYFLCNAYPDTIQKTVSKNLTEQLITSSICIESFGGYQPYSSKKNALQSGIKKENILIFAKQIIG